MSLARYRELKEHNDCYYFELQDLISTLSKWIGLNVWNPGKDTFDASPSTLVSLFTNIYSSSTSSEEFWTFNALSGLDTSNLSLITSSTGQKFFLNLFTKFRKCYTISIDEIYDYAVSSLDPSSELFANLRAQVISAIDFLNRIVMKFTLTYPKYSTLLSIYDTEASNLMDGINNSYTDTRSESTTGSSSGNNRLNDTPQDSGTFTDDEHTSSYSENASEAQSSLTSTFTHTQTDEVEILIDRLDKVQNKYQNLMQKWVDEFKNMFIMPVALDCEVNLNE